MGSVAKTRIAERVLCSRGGVQPPKRSQNTKNRATDAKMRLVYEKRVIGWWARRGWHKEYAGLPLATPKRTGFESAQSETRRERRSTRLYYPIFELFWSRFWYGWRTDSRRREGKPHHFIAIRVHKGWYAAKCRAINRRHSRISTEHKRRADQWQPTEIGWKQ